ncbi:hypothetical protein Tco_0349253, partial [Tanacetum coccineum]
METMKVGTSNHKKRLAVTCNRETRIVPVPVPSFGMVGLGKVDDSMIVAVTSSCSVMGFEAQTCLEVSADCSALDYHVAFHGAEPLISDYREGKKAISANPPSPRFGAVNEDLMARLKNLKYESSMKEYQSKFEQLLSQADNTESQYVNMFIARFPT